MTTVISDFEKRVIEIEKYFILVDSISEKNAQLYFPNKRTHRYQVQDQELIKVLKANIFLLLYNLAESSIKQSISEIYDGITNKQIRYKEAIDEIKKIWISEKHKNFRTVGTENIFNAINNIAEEIIEIRFDSDKVISGNIDGRKIKEFAELHGFSNKVHRNADEGRKLHLVKTQRNNLAHGNLSFAECGRNYTMTDLHKTKHEVIIYLRRILKNIDSYLNRQEYKL